MSETTLVCNLHMYWVRSNHVDHSESLCHSPKIKTAHTPFLATPTLGARNIPFHPKKYRCSICSIVYNLYLRVNYRWDTKADAKKLALSHRNKEIERAKSIKELSSHHSHITQTCTSWSRTMTLLSLDPCYDFTINAMHDMLPYFSLPSST